MPYKCIHGGLTRPCIYDPRYDKDLSEEGKLKRKKVYRSARKGDEFPFVCPISRKYFEPTDEETRQQDKRDLERISAELKTLGVKVPKDATVWEAAINLSKLEQIERKKKEKKPTRIFEKIETEEQMSEGPELTNRELREKLDDLNVKYPPNSNKATLKQLLADNQPDKDD